MIGVAALAVALGLLYACASRSAPEQWDNSALGPLVPHTTFPGECALCHTTDRWDVIREDFAFDHAAETSVELTGAHASANCLRCHNDRGPVATFVARGCGGCHADPHRDSLGSDCETCHAETTWAPIGQIAEHQQTRFILVGAHLATACNACHTQADVGTFAGTPTECEACHADLAVNVADPDHAGNGWLDDCERCHSEVGFDRPHFDHENFPLTGQHALEPCTACHTGGTFGPLPTDCNSCHAADAVAAPIDHTPFGTQCEDCHTTSGWSPASFPHPDFPLSGAHAGLSCLGCHLGGVLTTFTCTTSCHPQGSMDNKHSGIGGYTYDSDACLSCHPTGQGD